MRVNNVLLKDKEWKEFYIGDLFTVKRPKARSEKDYKPGNIPFVASGNFNNGVIRYCEAQLDEGLDECNCITVSPIDGSAFYQKSKFLGRGGAGSSVLLLYCNEMNKHSGLFISRVIRQTCSKYCYGKMGNQEGIKREKILLPVEDTGNPDYAFMEAYIKEQEEEKKQKYIAYAKKTLAKLEYKEIPTLKEKEWKEFYISGENGLFSLESTSSGIDKNKLNAFSGDIPYVTRTDKNNGIDMFVTGSQEDKYRIDCNNVISIGLDTQTVFYQPYMFLTGQNIQVLSNSSLNEYNAQFISTLLKIQLKKFNWGGNGATLSRLRRTKTLLPANAERSPDYAYMEQYVKNIMYTQLNKYLSYSQL